MNKWDDTNLTNWLDAETADAPDEADRLFAALSAVHLRRLHAPAGLAERIVAALPAGDLLPARPVFDPASSWWVRLTALAAVVLLGLGLALVSPRDLVALTAETAAVAGRLLHHTVASLGAALGVWGASVGLLVALGQTAGLVFTSGLMPLLIAANLAVASAAFAGLRHLLTPGEECVS